MTGTVPVGVKDSDSTLYQDTTGGGQDGNKVRDYTDTDATADATGSTATISQDGDSEKMGFI